MGRPGPPIVTVRARPVGPHACGPVTARCLPPPPRRRRRSRRQVSPSTLPRRGTWGRRSWAGSCSTGGRTMAGSAAPSPVSARAARSHTWWRTRARRQRCAARRTRCSTPPPTVPGGCCSLRRPLPASWPGLGPADPGPDPGPNFQFGRWLVTVRARPVGPDGCGPVTATGNRDNKEIRSMSGPMSERAPDIKVEADGRAESTTVTVLGARASVRGLSKSLSRVAGRGETSRPFLVARGNREPGPT